ncbi:dihydroxyacetone phosphate acyltransferase [Contarinia nasturtii]|uniref:dihydroxyacetone phosphate acyltransferase n=1 Tax=Contarinia nasturtii TaxID=265458 RepID=UPI0012D40353|nr:dihydroxyacetone phosphate acyltransferase [Contarinia nasturtii]
MENFVNLIEGDRLPDMGKYWQPLIPYKFENLLTPETLKTTVLHSEEVDRICKFYSDGDDKKEAQLRRIIKLQLEEIGFKRKMTVIRFLGIMLNKILLQMTHGVYVNRKSLELVKRELAQSRCPVLYLPTHRSYLDFILMSYICFAHDLEIPAIAAGMDFHGMVGMGSMLRNTGAFFMRRSFSSDKMYWEVFREYARTLISRYHSGVEFFIEGTRSRSCKALSPKIGLLSMMLETFMKRKVFDILVVPVGISYCRPFEEKLFAYELLGVPKPKESTRGLFKAFEIMDSCHGKMFVNFGKTISLHEYFEKDPSIYWSPNEPFAQNLTKERLQLISALSCHIVDKQQQLIVLNTFNLIAIYFAYRSMINEKCNRDQLKYGIGLLVNFLKKFEVLLALEIPSKSDSDITDSLEIHANVLQFKSKEANAPLSLVFGPIVASSNIDPSNLKGHSLSPHTMQNTLPSFLLQIYANPCMYWLHQPAFYVLVRRLGGRSQEEVVTEIDQLKRIFSSEFITRKCTQDTKKIVEIMDSMNISENMELENVLLTSILPFVFCYFNVVQVIKNQLSSKPFKDKDLFVRAQMYVEARLNGNAEFVHPYCLSLDSISNALHSLVANNCVTKKTITNAVQYTVNLDAINQLDDNLRRLCSILRHFNGLSNYNSRAKL